MSCAETEWTHVGVVLAAVRGRSRPGFFLFGTRYKLTEVHLFRLPNDGYLPHLWGRLNMKEVDYILEEEGVRLKTNKHAFTDSGNPGDIANSCAYCFKAFTCCSLLSCGRWKMVMF